MTFMPIMLGGYHGVGADAQSHGRERPLPRLARELLPEALVLLRADPLEPRALVNPSRIFQDVLRRTRHLPESARRREADALVDEPAEAVPADPRVDEQQTELRRAGVPLQREDAPRAFAIDLGDLRGAPRVRRRLVLGFPRMAVASVFSALDL
jgi:hypothetical protein